jgi:TetR/AcrR family transcriptional regulator, mexCD-oprJ operon repressor
VASRGRTATKHGILAAAASVLAARQGASMAEVAAAAGIARGTLYRHFPTCESLLRALEGAANEEAGRRLAEADLDGVPVDEALARVVRALVAVGEDFIVLLRERRPPEPGFAGPLVALIERGRATGEIRSDAPVTTLVESLLASLEPAFGPDTRPRSDRRASARWRSGYSSPEPARAPTDECTPFTAPSPGSAPNAPTADVPPGKQQSS